MWCKHNCGRRGKERRGGLCGPCYGDLAIRRLYVACVPRKYAGKVPADERLPEDPRVTAWREWRPPAGSAAAKGTLTARSTDAGSDEED